MCRDLFSGSQHTHTHTQDHSDKGARWCVMLDAASKWIACRRCRIETMTKETRNNNKYLADEWCWRRLINCPTWISSINSFRCAMSRIYGRMKIWFANARYPWVLLKHQNKAKEKNEINYRQPLPALGAWTSTTQTQAKYVWYIADASHESNRAERAIAHAHQSRWQAKKSDRIVPGD